VFGYIDWAKEDYHIHTPERNKMTTKTATTSKGAPRVSPSTAAAPTNKKNSSDKKMRRPASQQAYQLT